jgi:hypothetical protein
MFVVEDPSRQFDATHLGILALGLVTKSKSQLILSDEAQMDFAMTRGEATRPSQMICQLWRDPRLHLGKRGSLVQTQANLSHSCRLHVHPRAVCWLLHARRLCEIMTWYRFPGCGEGELQLAGKRSFVNAGQSQPTLPIMQLSPRSRSLLISKHQPQIVTFFAATSKIKHFSPLHISQLLR